MDLLVFGLGYSASRFVALHRQHFSTVTATVREMAERRASASGIEIITFDGRRGSPELAQAVHRATHVLVSTPPDEEGDPVLRNLEAEILAAPRLGWIGYLSTVGVYGDFGGGWVDEETPIRPAAPRNRRRAAIEAEWIDLASRRATAVQVFRLSGIYGPGQNAVENMKDGSARRIVKPGQVFNRIHVDDIAGAVLAGMRRPSVGPVINVTDDEPAPPQDVVSYAAELLGLPPPPEIAFDEAPLSPMGRSFYAENKRVSNRRMRFDLGYGLRFPTYREGLRSFVEKPKS
jgi:nucleoside-diphosphate-sugar epimerase